MLHLGRSHRVKRDLWDTSKPLEQKSIDKLLKSLEQLQEALSNQPQCRQMRQPNLLATLPKLRRTVQAVWCACDTAELSANFTFRIVLQALSDQSCELHQLAREFAKELQQTDSKAQKLYAQWSQSLHCLLLQLEAQFPGGGFVRHQISSCQAAGSWWQQQFGIADSVAWHQFQVALGQKFRIESLLEANALKRDVNVTLSDHVSAFEFDQFVRLFAPWNERTLSLWRTVTTEHPGFVRASFAEVKRLLRGLRSFSFLFRRSTNRPGVWAIGYVDGSAGGVTQILVKEGKTIVEALEEGERSGLLLYPGGKNASEAPSLESFAATAGDSATAKEEPAAHDVYVMPSHLRCSRCRHRVEAPLCLPACDHALCDLCFEECVQPLLDCRQSQVTFCPLCDTRQQQQQAQWERSDSEAETEAETETEADNVGAASTQEPRSNDKLLMNWLTQQQQQQPAATQRQLQKLKAAAKACGLCLRQSGAGQQLRFELVPRGPANQQAPGEESPYAALWEATTGSPHSPMVAVARQWSSGTDAD